MAKTAAKAKTSSWDDGSVRLYETLVRVLDSLRSEAPPKDAVYHPPKGNHDAVIQARSRALLHLFLKARFGLTSHAARESFVTDGKYDGGIDAYYIDRSHKKVYLLQSKFRANAKNFATVHMTPSDLLKMDVARIMQGETASEAGNLYNPQIKRMQSDIRKIPDRGSYEHRVVLLGNSEVLTPGELKKLVEGYPVDQFPHQKIFKELMLPVVHGTYFTDPELTIEINLDSLNSKNASLDYDVSATGVDANINVFFAPTKEIGRIMSTYRNSILAFNPRSFLELTKNRVNKEIEASLRKSGGNDFAMFNNGLTLIADRTGVSSNTATKGRAQVVVTNPQLVNGGQTAYTLARIYDEGDHSVFKGKEVLVKVVSIEPKKSKLQARSNLIKDISRASNSQTKIDEADRRSNDQVQLDLQAAFFEGYGLYYERKRGEFSDGVHDGYIGENDIINRENLVRVSLATSYKSAQTKAGVEKFFKEPVFSSALKVSDVGRYAFGYKALQYLATEKAKVKGDRWQQKKYGQALRYGEFAVVAVCVNLGVKSGQSPSDVAMKILNQWKKFEAAASRKRSNAAYVAGPTLDWVSYYKGATVDDDLKAFGFTI